MKDYILELDKPRKLKFGFKASRLIREKFGNMDLKDIGNMHIEDMPTIAWAGLVWEEEGLTVERVEELLDAKIPDKYTLIHCMEIVIEALCSHIGATPVPPEKKKKKKQQPVKKIHSKKKES